MNKMNITLAPADTEFAAEQASDYVKEWLKGYFNPLCVSHSFNRSSLYWMAALSASSLELLYAATEKDLALGLTLKASGSLTDQWLFFDGVEAYVEFSEVPPSFLKYFV